MANNKIEILKLNCEVQGLRFKDQG